MVSDCRVRVAPTSRRKRVEFFQMPRSKVHEEIICRFPGENCASTSFTSLPSTPPPPPFHSPSRLLFLCFPPLSSSSYSTLSPPSPFFSPPSPPPRPSPWVRCPLSLQTLVSFVEENLEDTLGGEGGGKKKNCREGGGRGGKAVLPPLSWVFFKSPDNGFLLEEDLKITKQSTKHKAKAQKQSTQQSKTKQSTKKHEASHKARHSTMQSTKQQHKSKVQSKSGRGGGESKKKKPALLPPRVFSFFLPLLPPPDQARKRLHNLDFKECCWNTVCCFAGLLVVLKVPYSTLRRARLLKHQITSR